MTASHTIHLGNAWEPVAAGAEGWVRRFGRPTGLGPEDAVWLVIERPAACSVSLNDVSLPAAAGQLWRHEITFLLAGRNVLVLGPTADAVRRPLPAGRGQSALPADRGRVLLEIVSPTPDHA